jgi:two-component system osmolarity sensor histidine kinase EnvZ
MNRPVRGVFAQLVLVIVLVLAGTSTLALLLSREFTRRPPTEQLLHSIDAFADTVETLDRIQPSAHTLESLRNSGFEVRTQPPVPAEDNNSPWFSLIEKRARRVLGDRDVVTGPGPRGDALWLKLNTTQPLWVSFAQGTREGARRFSVLLLASCALLVWLAAAYFARRLTQPLKQLAAAAPALMRGEDVGLGGAGAPREVRELQSVLLRASGEVREAASERLLMLAGISHDLRTPLTRVQYALALLPDTDPDLRDGMERDIGEIDAILSQFIAYARDGRDEAVEDVDLAETCRNALAAAAQDWETEIPSQASLRGRPMALLRAIENLVGNAERHGEPAFALALRRDRDAWRIEVADQGPGLSADAARRARQPFVHDGSAGGTGLGLAIVDRIARQHHGELQLLANTPRGLRAVLLLRDA